MDAQIAHRLQAMSKFQTYRQTRPSVQAPHRQNRQHPPPGQVRSNRYSGHNEAVRGLESNQIERQTTRDIYP